MERCRKQRLAKRTEEYDRGRGEDRRGVEKNGRNFGRGR
jgi:hypothetical protein